MNQHIFSTPVFFMVALTILESTASAQVYHAKNPGKCSDLHDNIRNQDDIEGNLKLLAASYCRRPGVNWKGTKITVRISDDALFCEGHITTVCNLSRLTNPADCNDSHGTKIKTKLLEYVIRHYSNCWHESGLRIPSLLRQYGSLDAGGNLILVAISMSILDDLYELSHNDQQGLLENLRRLQTEIRQREITCNNDLISLSSNQQEQGDTSLIIRRIEYIHSGRGAPGIDSDVGASYRGLFQGRLSSTAIANRLSPESVFNRLDAAGTDTSNTRVQFRSLRVCLDNYRTRSRSATPQ